MDNSDSRLEERKRTFKPVYLTESILTREDYAIALRKTHKKSLVDERRKKAVPSTDTIQIEAASLNHLNTKHLQDNVNLVIFK